MLILPLIYGEKLIGTLELFSALSHSLSSDDINLLTTLADQTAIAVQNARLFEETQLRLNEISLLYNLSAELRTIMTSDEMLLPILNRAMQALDADGALALTLDANTETLQVWDATGEYLSLVGRNHLLEDMPKDCAMRRRMFCFGQEDCPFLPRCGHPLNVACVTFEVGEKIFGGLHVGRRKTDGFSEDEIRLLDGIANIATNALRRAALFEELRLIKYAFDSTADAIQITDVEGYLAEVNPAFVRITGYSREEALGKKSSLIKSQHSTPEFYEQMWSRILEEGFWTGEIINRRKNGEEWNSYLTISTVKDERDKPIAYIGINRDITESKQRERERETILAVATALRTANTRAEMLPVLLDQVLTLLDAGGATLVLRDQLTGEMAIELGIGKWTHYTGIRVPEGEGVSGLVIATGKPYVSDSLQNDSHIWQSDLLAGLEAGVCVPLISQTQTIGALWAGREKAFTEEEVRLLTAVGDMAANAIQRASLHEQNMRRAEQLAVINQLSLTLAETLDLSQIYAHSSETIDNILPDIASIFISLYDPDKQMITCAHAIHDDEVLDVEKLPPISLEVTGVGTQSEAIRTRRPFIVNDLQARLETVKSNTVVGTPGPITQSGLYVPMLAEGEVIGVVQVQSYIPNRFSQDDANMLSLIANTTAIAIDNARLFGDLQKANVDLIHAYDTTLEGWSFALDLRDEETEGHTRRVTEMTITLARDMGFKEEELIHVRRGALLHDIGKMGIPDSILLKPGPLTKEEWNIMRQHPVHACEMLTPIEYLRQALDIPCSHHEKWDGTGYPSGLQGEQISLAARIFAVVDVWDALSSDRPYRQAWPAEKVWDYIQEQSGKHFDPRVVEAFLNMIHNQKLEQS